MIRSIIPKTKYNLSKPNLSWVEDQSISSHGEDITQTSEAVGGLNIHVAEIGSGFHAIAPDFRGYELSDQPSATLVDLVEDITKVFVVRADFGALVAYFLDLLYPDRVRGVVTLDIPYLRPGARKRFGRFWTFDIKTVVKNIYILFSRSELPVAEEGKEIMDLVEPSTPLPHWFTEDDLKMYSNLYEKSGFGYPLQVPYLCMIRDWGKLTQLTEYTIQAPTLLIVGNRDYVQKLAGMEQYINSEMLKAVVPKLTVKYVAEGSHFVQEQFPEEVNKHILGWLNHQM
eukprot:Gb_16224 [translate_table: standard]